MQIMLAARAIHDANWRSAIRHQTESCKMNWLAAIAVATLICFGLSVVHAGDMPSKAYSIGPQPVSTALKAFAAQSGLQLIFTEADVGVAETGGIDGYRSPREALSELLRGTGLEFEFTANNIIVVRKATLKAATRNASFSGLFPLAVGAETSDGQGVHLAQTAGTPSSIPPDGDQAAPSANKSKQISEQLDEVIVTAQKRNERLQDVPVPVTAISAETLVANNQLRIQDYFSSVPGLNVTPGTQSSQVLTIRGINTGGGNNPTVGITVDDMPYGNSTVLGGGQMVPDIDPGDLARIEVLRGPQGTLYGASSMGGLLKFVTVDPSTAGFSGHVQAGLSSVYNGAELGYNVRAAANVPLSDTLAVRVSGFTRVDPGYIDDPVLNIDGVNKTTAYGGLLSALWRPSDLLSLKVIALLQDLKSDGAGDVDVEPGLGNLQQSSIRGIGGFDRKIQDFGATLTVKLGVVDLTAVSGYSTNRTSDSFDYTSVLGTFAQSDFGVPGAAVTENLKNSKFSQEFRLSAPLGPSFEWLLGGFYSYEHSYWYQSVPALDPDTGATAGELLYGFFPTMYSEFAEFADLTVHVTDRFDIQVGARESEIRQTLTETDVGLLVGGISAQPEGESKSNAFTYLLTPRFKVSPDLMVYARLASGYRAGGPNSNCVLNHVPCQYDPDKTQNYELGAKGDFLDHTFSLDASLYYINWKNIQLSFAGLNGGDYYANGSAAKSEGLELEAELRPLPGLTLAAWTAWNQAVITEPSPPASAQPLFPGERLPLSSRFSANFSVEQRFPLSRGVEGFVGGDVSYVGNRASAIGASGSEIFPSYTKTDLRAGAKYDLWTVNFFATNVANVRGILGGGTGTVVPSAYYYIQPRTIGMSVLRAF